MSGFLPDLASWALRGGAGDETENADGNEDADATGAHLTEEEIRDRRLARMTPFEQQAPTADEAQPMDVDSPKSSVEPDVKRNNVKQTKPVPAQANPVENPSHRSATAKKPVVANRVALAAAAPKVTKPSPERKKTKLTSPVDVSRKMHRKKELLVKKVLQIVITPSANMDHSCVVVEMETIEKETIQELLAVRLAMDPNDRALAWLPTQKKAVVPYLGECHKRAGQELKTMAQSTKSKAPLNELEDILREIQDQVVCYAASSLMEPDLFELGQNGAKDLAQCLLNTTTDLASSITVGVDGKPSSSFYHMVCAELVSQDPQAFDTVISAVVSYLIAKLRKLDTVLDGDDGGGGVVIVSALASLCSNKSAAQAATRMRSFLLPAKSTPAAQELVVPPPPGLPPGASEQQASVFRLMQAMNRGGNAGYLKRSGPALEQETVLGAAFRLGCPKASPTVTAGFANLMSATMDSVEKTTEFQRRQLKAYQDGLNQLIKNIVVAGADARNEVMKWFVDAFLVNVGADAMRPDLNKVSSEATLINLSVVLLRLCNPFMSSEKKASLIDPGFVSSEEDNGGVFVMIGDDAVPRLGENPSAPSEPYEPKNYFIPQCFFFAARSLHFGIVPMSSFHHNLLRQISHMHWNLRSRGADVRSDPRFNQILGMQRASEVTLFAEDMVADTFRFCNLMAGVLLTMDDEQLRLMPEHFVDDICRILQFMAKFKANLMVGVDFKHVFQMVVKLLSPKYAPMVRNYNLRAKLGDVLYEVFLPTDADDDDRREVPASVTMDPLAGGRTYLLSDPSSQETLAPSLLLLYGEVEHTGHYEKMGHRARIASLIKYLWESSEHRPAFRRITQNKDSFIKFANGIMNETNQLIATVMEKLPSIRQVQLQRANAQEWAALAEEQRETISSRHEEDEEEVKRALPLCNRTLRMLGYLNTDEDIRKLFLLDEMCSRLVNMLMHVLTKLVGAKGLELKVDNPEEYNFRPKEMLRDLCAVFALFASANEFIVECAKSGYYNSDLVVKAVKTCRKLNLLTGTSMDELASLPESVEAAGKDVAVEEAIGEDAPEEFHDNLLYTLMRDPVYLPTSGKYVDRSTIAQHLLNDPSDPFTRAPLTIDKVEPATELKEKIITWIAEKRASMEQG